jgi:hypothetical protein
MSNGLIAFFVAVGVSIWTYNKFYKTTGGYSQKALGGAAVAGILAFIIFLTLLWSIT